MLEEGMFQYVNILKLVQLLPTQPFGSLDRPTPRGQLGQSFVI